MAASFSFDSYKSMFDSYAKLFDCGDGRVELKIVHTYAVVSIMEKLCGLRRLPDHTANLARLCALFHDIGRFEQLRRFDTFLDHLSVDHALLSCQILEERGILMDLPEGDRHKVLTAIANHNRLEIDPALTDAVAHAASDAEAADAKECLALCRLIRDADKCDIFRVFAMDDMKDVVGVPEEVIADESITPEVLQAVREHRSIDKVIRKTYLDHWVSYLGYLFDLNYAESMKIAKEQGYYRMPFDRTFFHNPATREQVKEVLDIIEQYISHFSGKPEPEREKPASSDFSIAPPKETVPNSLRQFFKEHPSLALAFSGGTDSAYLLYAAKACGCQVRAYYVSTPFQPEFERRDAERLANQLQADMAVLSFPVLDIEAIRQNPPGRCYHCKNAIFHKIIEAAAQDGYTEIMDGTNASDDAGDRPGMRALQELKVLSPLRLCGITKKALREYSRKAGLFTWDKPAYACLATRVPTGHALSEGLLKKIEQAEDTLAKMGFVDFRVRVLPLADSYAARIQVTSPQLPLLMEKREEILMSFKASFPAVLLDLDARAASV